MVRLGSNLDFLNGYKSLAFSPDGTRLATVDGHECRIDVVHTSTLIRLALTRLTRNLSPEEWNSYLPEIQYRILRSDLSSAAE